MSRASALSSANTRLGTADELVVTPETVLSKTVGEVSRLLGLSNLAALSTAPAATVLGRATHERPTIEAAARRHTPLGVRHFVAPQEGSGYWDFFSPLPHVMVSITDCVYRIPAWAPVHGESIFKLRLLCSGRLLAADRSPLLEGRGLYASFHQQGADSGYYIDSGQPVRMVIIHMFPEAFENALGMTPQELPGSYANAATDPDAFRRVSLLSPKLYDAAVDLLESRYACVGKLRMNFIQAKCLEILTLLLNDARNAELDASLGARLTSRDRNIVEDAREYLLENFRAPPSISLLARRVGMSPTKLKSAFKHVCGSTIHTFVQDVRMRKASALLLAGDRTVSEIAYAVGYDHPANFTSAFRKHYGFLPSALKPRRAR